MNYLDLMQWPAMAATLLATWLVGTQTKKRLAAGFWLFMLSNVLWGVWAIHDQAYALIALQVGLFIFNIRALVRNDR